jgi:hypothetical protein
VICECALRRIFAICVHRAQECLEHPVENGPVGIEYAADIQWAAQRELDAEDYRIFQYHLLQGHDYNACCARLHMHPTYFWGRVYRIQEVLGRVFAELEPYPLFPTYAYFKGWRHEKAPALHRNQQNLNVIRGRVIVHSLGWYSL